MSNEEIQGNDKIRMTNDKKIPSLNFQPVCP